MAGPRLLVPRAQLVDRVHERPHGIDGRVREDAVPEVEDVSRPAGRLREDGGDALANDPRRREQRAGIEIPLDRTMRADPPPCLRERDSPVDADDVSARGRDELEIAR